MEKQNSQTISRDEMIDVLKGFAIFCVVLGHIHPIMPVLNFIYSFHMALFMFLSGITFWFSFEQKRIAGLMNRKKSCLYILKRCASLLLPFAAWCGIKGIVLENQLDFLKNVQHNFNYYWFLPTLFGIIVFAAVPNLFRKSDSAKTDFLFDLLVLFISAFLCALCFKHTQIKVFRQILIYLPFFYFGLFVKKYAFIERIFTSHFAIGFSIFAYLFVFPFYSIDDSSRLSLAARFVTGFLFTVIIYNFARAYHDELPAGVQKCISNFGKHSLQIYVIQEFFRNTIPIQITGGGGYWVDSSVRMLIALCICFIGIILSKFADMTIWLNFVLFGKFGINREIEK